MSYSRGKPLEPSEKYAVVSVKKYFDRIRNDLGLTDESAQLTADALQFGVSTVRRVMADFNRDPSSLNRMPAPKGRPEQVIDLSHEAAIRQFIRSANQNGQYITIASISEFLKDRDKNVTFHSTTLARTLNRWGFEFGKGKRSQHLKEKDDVILARQQYLRLMKSNRDKDDQPIRNEIYLDESYVNKNHSNDFIWYFGEDGPWVQKPTGKGERLIIVNAISSYGWVDGAKLVFQAKRKTGDYHGQMNAEMFTKWFQEKLIPNIAHNSLIIMDNASYHKELSDDSPPTPVSSKNNIREWLTKNKIYYEDDSLKAELIEKLMFLHLKPIYKIDKIAEQFGHKVVRTPPYHPELQPIEVCWGIVKNHIGRNCNFTLANLKLELDIGFTKVTPETCRGIIKKIKKKEDQFLDEDVALDPSE